MIYYALLRLRLDDTPSTLPALSYFEWRAFAKLLVCIGKFLPVTCFHACIVTHSCDRTVFPRNLSFVSVV